MGFPSVGIVIVSWNKKNDLMNLLVGLEGLKYQNVEIIVVDNASTDGSALEVKTRYPEIILLVNETNKGGTGGFNTGLEYCLVAGYDYIWLLDNDAKITPESLDHLVAVAESDSDIGIVGSKILNVDSPAFIVKLGANIDWGRGLVRSISQNVRDFACAEDCLNVDYVPFCSALICRDCLLATGILDERFFLYWDDADFCLRAIKLGYKTTVATKSIIFHPSFTEKSRDCNYYLTRNTFIFFAKHVNPLLMIRTQYNVLSRLLKHMLFAYIIEDRKSVSILSDSLIDFFRRRFGKANGEYQNVFPCSSLQKILSHEIIGEKCLITFEGTAEFMKHAFNVLTYSKKTVTLLVPFSRSDLYSDLSGNKLIFDDRVNNLMFENIKIFFKIIKGGYDTIVTTHRSMTPFAFAVSRTYFFDGISGTFSEVPICRKKLPYLFGTIVMSYFLTLFILPMLWYVSVSMIKRSS